MFNLKTGDYITIKYSVIKYLNDCGIKNGNEIMLFAVLDCLSRRKRQCTASNKYLADVLCCSERNIQKYLKDLKDRDIIKTFDKKVDGSSSRIIYLHKN